jgi:hypothetical protein
VKDVKPFVFDEFAWKLADHLLEDFKPFWSGPDCDAVTEAFASRNVVKVRQLALGEKVHQPYHFKILYQMLSLLKKYQFQHDLHTPAQLREDSVKKFMDNQERLSNFEFPDDPIVRSIVFGARGYVDQILGYFDPLEVMDEATFGKKSSVGIPLTKACESERFEAPITGSLDHITWYDKIFSSYHRPGHLYGQRRAVLFSKPPYREVDEVEAVLVDKTWKSLRMIVPNTTIGTLYTGGLGRVIEGRLRRYGYDIKHLQDAHGQLARIGSITGSLVTADQSMASDNITCHLVDLLLPRPWASALKLGRISKMRLYGRTLDTKTFSTMGIGFTFPLQTLVFLCLLLAIRDHLKLSEQTVVSVFGDDLIYDHQMHLTVCDVFGKLGLLINEDKTFSEGNFRESCGHDFYHGIDVRPFLLGRASGIDAGKRQAEAYLYKTANTLLRRWSWSEVPSTLSFITGLIAEVRFGEPLVVPLDFPDDSGVKLTYEAARVFGFPKTLTRDQHGTIRFKYLAFEADRRVELRHEPLLFRALRSPSTPVSLPFPKRGVGCVLEEKPSPFKEIDHPTAKPFRSELTGKRLKPRLTLITNHDKGRYRERSGITSNWTPGNREA